MTQIEVESLTRSIDALDAKIDALLADPNSDEDVIEGLIEELEELEALQPPDHSTFLPEFFGEDNLPW